MSISSRLVLHTTTFCICRQTIKTKIVFQETPPPPPPPPQSNPKSFLLCFSNLCCDDKCNCRLDSVHRLFNEQSFIYISHRNWREGANVQNAGHQRLGFDSGTGGVDVFRQQIAVFSQPEPSALRAHMRSVTGLIVRFSNMSSSSLHLFISSSLHRPLRCKLVVDECGF